MTDQPIRPKLKPSVDVEGGAVIVGPNPQPPNAFTLKVKNEGETVEQQPPDRVFLFLECFMGSRPDALFGDLNDAASGKWHASSPTGWRVEPDFLGEDEDIFRFKLLTNDKTLFKNGQELEFTFSDLIVKTVPDTNAILNFRTSLSDESQRLEIPKQALEPNIISFASDPEEGAQILPGEQIELSWSTYKLCPVELTQVGISDPIYRIEKLEDQNKPDTRSHTVENIIADTEFRLRGYAGSKPIDRTLKVNVLRNGWYDVRNTVSQGDPGYPDPQDNGQNRDQRFDLQPTQLFNANNERLYGIFRRDDGKAFLFENKNPFGRWRIVTRSSEVSDLPEPVPFPEACHPDSPGVYHDEKLYLIGGSQVDPDIFDNKVWRLDLEKERKDWVPLGPADWRARMGHAVVEFNNRVWVMGGCNDASEPLNDVWTLDLGKSREKGWKPKWEEGPKDGFPNLCLFSAAVHDSEIWIYGGAQNPNPSSDDIRDDMHTLSEGKWRQVKLMNVIKGNQSRKPIASCLQVFNDRIHLFGKFRTVNDQDNSRLVESLAFTLSSRTTRTWTRFASDALQDWWSDDGASSYQVVNFANKMLIARVLGTRNLNPALKVYIPG